jgi:hypothetical protein
MNNEQIFCLYLITSNLFYFYFYRITQFDFDAVLLGGGGGAALCQGYELHPIGFLIP